MIRRTFKNNFKWIFAVLFFCTAYQTVQAAPGDLDSSFNGTGKVRVPIGASGEGAQYEQGIVRQSDGKIIVASSCRNVAITVFCAARYNTNGQLDTTYSGDGRANIDFTGGVDDGFALALDSFGRAIVGGAASGYLGIARLQN